MTIKNLYPSVRPTLDLNFTQTKQLDPRITFSRSSSGTYFDNTGVLRTARANQARFDHDPVTGESLGLLVEEARSNLLLNSGTLATQSVTVTATAYWLSFYGTGSITLSGASTAGPLVGTGTNDRVVLGFTPTAGTLTLSVAGTVTNAQLEAGSFPTSYIPTAGSTVTRAADVAQITGTNFSGWYNQSEGTIATDLIPSTVGSLAIWTVSDGTTSERMLSYTGTTFSFYVQDGGVSQVQYDAGGYTAGVPRKAASAFATNNFNYARDGVVNTTDTSGSLPTVDRLQLMAGHSGGQIQSGHLRRFTFYPVRLSDATLRALTL